MPAAADSKLAFVAALEAAVKAKHWKAVPPIVFCIKDQYFEQGTFKVEATYVSLEGDDAPYVEPLVIGPATRTTNLYELCGNLGQEATTNEAYPNGLRFPVMESALLFRLEPAGEGKKRWSLVTMQRPVDHDPLAVHVEFPAGA